MRITRSERSDEDLIDIWTNIALDNPAAADRMVDKISRHWEQLNPARPPRTTPHRIKFRRRVTAITAS